MYRSPDLGWKRSPKGRPQTCSRGRLGPGTARSHSDVLTQTKKEKKKQKRKVFAIVGVGRKERQCSTAVMEAGGALSEGTERCYKAVGEGR